MGYDILPSIKNYTKFADQNVKSLDYGGIVAYVENSLAPHVFDVKYNTCFISLRLDHIPQFVFIGMYIQPERSSHFDSDMFGILGSYLLSLRERNLVPILGGDMNCRFGELSYAFQEQRLAYVENKDNTSNYHGRTYGIDLCNSCKIFPLNHLRMYNRTFPGDFTYHKADKKSQIDYVFTDRTGMKYIKNYEICSENWHLSDHLPLCLEIKASEAINCHALLRRSKDLNYEFDPQQTKPTRYLANYDADIFQDYLKSNYRSIEKAVLDELENENLNGAITTFEEQLKRAYKISKKKVSKTEQADFKKMEKANENFNKLQQCMNGDIAGDTAELLEAYQKSRKEVSQEVFTKEQAKWNEVIGDGSKKLWEKINWKGDLNSQNTQATNFEDLTANFEQLYSAPEEELEKIDELISDRHVPELDDPITEEELDKAMGKMKSGGYDHRLDNFKLIVKIFSPLILLILNIMFYINYPVELAVSLLNAIPKPGPPSPKNFRGIQMLRALAVLYDRIITNRLELWVCVNAVQSGFQKLKSTLHQIFTIRLLIEIAKMTNTTLYIGMFDLEKAFDKVSRYKLLQKLIAKGIGNCMLQALKRIYKFTYCVLSYGHDISTKFRTFTGIRQGAASSALLFIAFIDDLVKHLEERCEPEPMLDTLHCLLHADDTAILSTNRDLFVNKCNHMLDYFTENSLSLNLSKSGYLIINGKEEDIKCNLQLNNGILPYKSELKYLGVKISDSGSLREDVNRFVQDKRSNLSIKFRNFCRKQFLAPLFVKMNVLNSCVGASITYGCETWGMSTSKIAETAFRQGLKSALSVRDCTNNEIVYIESGEWPLEIRIIKQQMKFWTALEEIMSSDQEHYIAKLVKIGESTTYIKYYRTLMSTYTDVKTCNETLKRNFLNSTREKIEKAAREDPDSKLGAYLMINPELKPPEYEKKFEFQRVLSTRYRTGSHNLRIEKDRRFPNSKREDRVCKCEMGIQTVHHVILVCPLLQASRHKYGIVDIQSGVTNDDFLMEMECILNIKNH